MIFLRHWRVVLVVVLVLGYVVYRPEIIPNDGWRERVRGIRDFISQKSPPDTQALAEVFGHTREKVLGVYSALREEQRIPGLPDEVVVNDYVEDLTDKVKILPAEQLIQVKRSFCQDVIDEATGSARKNDL